MAAAKLQESNSLRHLELICSADMKWEEGIEKIAANNVGILYRAR